MLSHQYASLKNNVKDYWKFEFNHIFHNQKQLDIYNHTTKPIIKSVLNGYNGSIICYGQIGSGKTYTMIGSLSNYNLRGIIPRSIADIYKGIEKKQDEYDINVKISYLQIYKDHYYDLLATNTATNRLQKNLKVYHHTTNNHTYIKNLNYITANNEEDALKILFQGENNRAIGYHPLNNSYKSSRSHCIFTIFIEQISKIESSDKIISSKLTLVDLAGNDRVKISKINGLLLNEAKYINKSLSFFEQSIQSLINKRKIII